MKRTHLIFVALFAAAVIGAASLMSGCAAVSQAGGMLANAGLITSNQAASLSRTSEAVGKTLEQITPEQEYYIGRAVAATILTAYKPFVQKAATEYVNELGQTLSMASDRPETFGGYHFLILNTDEVNAFSAPGGLILVSRGMLRLCKNEDELAAVLAHEIGHVEFQHGLRAIKKGRLTSAFTILAAEGAKTFGGQQLADLTSAFEGSINDITSTLMNSGYARALESQADQAAVTIMKRVGYNPAGLVAMLSNMKSEMKPGEAGFAKTHPDPQDRINDVEKMIAPAVIKLSEPPARQSRFEKAMAGV